MCSKENMCAVGHNVSTQVDPATNLEITVISLVKKINDNI
jgi:hypothetical protein